MSEGILYAMKDPVLFGDPVFSEDPVGVKRSRMLRESVNEFGPI